MNQLEKMEKLEEVKNAYLIRTNQRCRAYFGGIIMTNKIDMTEMHEAARDGDTEEIKSLMDSGLRPDERTMSLAANNYQIETIKELHKLKAPIDMQRIVTELFEGMRCGSCCSGDNKYVEKEDVDVLRLLFKFEREEEEDDTVSI